MICDSCKQERLIKDFINNQNICYRCIYRDKIKKTPKIRTKTPCYCRTCGQEVINIKDLKKRQRTVFCSEKCALIGHKEITRNYWCRRVPNTFIGEASR